MLLNLIFLVGLWVCSQSIEWNLLDNNVQIPASTMYKNEMNTPNCPNNDSEECESSEESMDSLAKYLFLKKRINSNFFKSIQDNKKKPFHYGSRSCSCTTGFEILDLGRHYFPRHLHTAICKSNGCAEGYSCVGKRYTVRVLKEKQIDDAEIPAMINLPGSLRDFWVTDNVTVTVACECMP